MFVDIAPGKPACDCFHRGGLTVGVPVYILLARKFDTSVAIDVRHGLFWPLDVEFYFHHPRLGLARIACCRRYLRGIPQVFVIAPAVNLGLGSLPPERLKYASGLFNMMRNLGGAIGIAVMRHHVE